MPVFWMVVLPIIVGLAGMALLHSTTILLTAWCIAIVFSFALDAASRDRSSP